VNRFLLDKVAEAGRGEVEYVGLNDDGSAAARRFHERVRNPLLTDISIDWNGLPVADVYPQRIPDLFSVKPVVVTGRFTAPGRASIRLKGKMAGSEFVREIPVELPETMASHDVLASLWARARIDDLMGQDYQGAQVGTMREDLKNTITQLGIEYRLMTQFTSFVAVEEVVVTDGGQPRRIDVPVEVPVGVNPDAIGEGYLLKKEMAMKSMPMLSARTLPVAGGVISTRRSSRGMGVGAGTGAGIGVASASPAPPVNRPATVDMSVDAAKEPVDQRSIALTQKLHRSVFAVVERIKKKDPLTAADEAGFIHNGRAEVQVWLTEKSDAALAKLKELGFEVVLDAKNSKLIVGRIAIDKLEALADLKFVKYVAPQQ